MAAKLKEKRTYITTVPAQNLSFATFPTPPIFSLPTAFYRQKCHHFVSLVNMPCGRRFGLWQRFCLLFWGFLCYYCPGGVRRAAWWEAAVQAAQAGQHQASSPQVTYAYTVKKSYTVKNSYTVKKTYTVKKKKLIPLHMLVIVQPWGWFIDLFRDFYFILIGNSLVWITTVLSIAAWFRDESMLAKFRNYSVMRLRMLEKNVAKHMYVCMKRSNRVLYMTGFVAVV